MDLHGKVALVTGATGDMGSSFASACAEAGADLIVTSRTASRLEAFAESLRATTGRRVVAIAADLGDGGDAARLGREALAAVGRVDIVVNNAVPAGSQVIVGDLLSTPDDRWWAYYATIVLGPLALARVLVPAMQEAGRGAFVNVVSATGIVPTPGFDAYGLAKGGLVLLTKYMAREWGPFGIRANAVSPGLITNPHAVATGNEITKRTGLLERTALGRKGTKEEVVGAVVFLASDAASYISGEVLAVNGGRF